MHGDQPERVREKIADLSERRARHNLPPLKFGVAGYAIVRETEREAQDEQRRITDVQQFAAGYANYQQWLGGTHVGQAGSVGSYLGWKRRLGSGLGGRAGGESTSTSWHRWRSLPHSLSLYGSGGGLSRTSSCTACSSAS